MTKISITWDPITECVVLSQNSKDAILWCDFVRIISDYTDSYTLTGNKLIVPVQVFLVVRQEIAKFMRNHGISASMSDDIKALLKTTNVHSYHYACGQTPISAADLGSRLDSIGFVRKLTQNQINNVCRLAPLPGGATFSVPGAGKTTEALAYFFYNAADDDRLLVVAPVNAFGAWDEQISDCFGDDRYNFVRLRGGYDNIEKLLNANPQFILISYQQFPRVTDLIKRYLQNHSVYMFLDESHRIKRGSGGVSADAILNISWLPKKKLIMTGTPMPQSTADLIPQFDFLYPDKRANLDNAVQLIQPIYVRTTQGQLGIPEVKRIIKSFPMSSLQTSLYDVLRSETKRQMLAISPRSLRDLRDLSKAVMKVMEFVSNPSLLAADMNFIFNSELANLLAKETGPKIDYACNRARELAAEGKKVIIWSQFVKNVELIADRLSDLGADYIHGGVDAGSEEEEDTREWKIKEFHSNPGKMVLVANPAAASEGISLHKVCQYAIYVDRSFNAAHYLQSEDRIHRLGLRPNQTPVVEILECEDTLDEVIRARLNSKINTMATALNDSSLRIDNIPLEVEENGSGLDDDDVQAILSYFFDGSTIV